MSARPIFTLETARLRLDALTEADVPVAVREWGDPRVARMTTDRLAAIELEPVQKWLENILATAPIEVAFVTRRNRVCTGAS